MIVLLTEISRLYVPASSKLLAPERRMWYVLPAFAIKVSEEVATKGPSLLPIQVRKAQLPEKTAILELKELAVTVAVVILSLPVRLNHTPRDAAGIPHVSNSKSVKAPAVEAGIAIGSVARAVPASQLSFRGRANSCCHKKEQ